MKLLRKITQKQNRKEAIVRAKDIIDYEPQTDKEIKRQREENNRLLREMQVSAMSGIAPMAEIKFRDINIKDIPEKRIKDEMYFCNKCNTKKGNLYEYEDDEGYQIWCLCSKDRAKMKKSL